MKKIFSKLLLIFSTALLVNSCQNNQDSNNSENTSSNVSSSETSSSSEISSSTSEELNNEKISPNKYYEYNGKLHVDGKYLKNSKGEILQLNGVVASMSSLEPRTAWKEKERIEQLKKWGFNHMRIGYSMEREVTDEMYKDMEDIIKNLTDNGFYMELIAYNNATTLKNTEGYAKAKEFLTYFANKFKDQDNIIYCVGNEPDEYNGEHLTMEMIDEYAKAMINDITSIKKDAVIAVPTPYACSEIDDAIKSTIEYENTIYVCHLYQSMTNKGNDIYRRVQTAAANNICVYFSEWCAATPKSSEDYVSPEWASNAAYLINKNYYPNAYYVFYPGTDNVETDSVDPNPRLNHLGMIKQKYWKNDYTNPDALTIGGKFAVSNVANPIKEPYGFTYDECNTMINSGVNYMFHIWDEEIRTKTAKVSFETIEFTPTKYEQAWNLSYAGVGDITAYAVINDNNLYEITIVSNNKIILPENSGYMFSKWTSLEEVNFNNVDSSKVTNMQFMFSNDTNLKKVSFSSTFDTSNVKSMFATFTNCTSLEELDLSMFDTSSLENMTGIFQNCSNLKELNLKKASFTNVTKYSYPFAGCNPKIIVSSNEAKEFLITAAGKNLTIEIEN